MLTLRTAPAPARPNWSAATAGAGCRFSTRPPSASAAATGSTSTTTTSWPRRVSASCPPAEREINIWRFEELLPIVDARAQARVGRYSGRTPLIHADRLGAELGLKKLYLKDDSTSRPSLSYKDRVVSMAVARLLELGKEEIGCVSTGNVGTAVASLAAKAGVAAYVFYPSQHGARQGARLPGARRRRHASSTATTTKPTAPAASWPSPAASSSPTSPCARSTPRGRRRSPTRWSSSSSGRRPTTSSSRPPAARSPRACTRGWGSWRRWVWRRPRRPRSTSPRPRAAARSPPRSSTARGEIEPQTPAHRGALDRDRRARRRPAGGRRGDVARRLGARPPPTRRSSRRSTCSAPPRASSPSPPAAPRSPAP